MTSSVLGLSNASDRAELTCVAMIERWKRGGPIRAEDQVGPWSTPPTADEFFEVVYQEFLWGRRT